MLGRKDVGCDGHIHGMYLGNGRALARTKWGGKLLLDANDSLIAPYVLLDGEWEPHVTAVFRSLFKPGMVFVDVGANVGYYSMLAARMEAAQVYAFEPNPHCFRLLRQNAILNWVSHRVRCESTAVLDGDGSVKLQMRRRFPGNSSIGAVEKEHLESHDDEAEWVEVTTTSLDGYLEQKNVPKIDLLKVDVEGAEPAVFAGMERTLGTNRQLKVLCEWSPGQILAAGQSIESLWEIWRKFGFQLQWVEAGLQVISYDKLATLSYANVLLSRR